MLPPHHERPSSPLRCSLFYPTSPLPRRRCPRIAVNAPALPRPLLPASAGWQGRGRAGRRGIGSGEGRSGVEEGPRWGEGVHGVVEEERGGGASAARDGRSGVGRCGARRGGGHGKMAAGEGGIGHCRGLIGHTRPLVVGCGRRRLAAGIFFFIKKIS